MKRKILGGLAAAAMLAGGLAITSGAAAATSSEQPPPDTGDKCYETVPYVEYQHSRVVTTPDVEEVSHIEYLYEKEVPKFKTQNRYEKEVRIKGSDPAKWVDYPNAGPRPWGWDGQKTGPHNSTFNYDGDQVRSDRYRYVIVDTRQVPDGTTTESSGWVKDQLGDPWKLVDEKKVIDQEFIPGFDTTFYYTGSGDGSTNIDDAIWSESDPGAPWERFNEQSGERQVEVDCPVPDPEKLRLTFMQECGTFTPLDGPWVAPETVEFRLRNSNDVPVDYVLRQAGAGIIQQGTLPVGDTFVEFPFGARTLILETYNEAGDKVSQDTKAGGDTFLTTDDDGEKCLPPTPEKDDSYTEWTGEPKCDETEYVQTRTVVSYSFEWDGSKFIETAVGSKETRIVQVEEVEPCPTVPPTTEPPTTEPPTTEPPTTEPPTTEPPVTIPPVTTQPPPPVTAPPTVPPTVPPQGLPATGSNATNVMVLLGALFAALGGAAIVASRRKPVL